MIIFLYGQDTYRSRLKLNEIIRHYQKIHQSGLNLEYLDFKKDSYENFETDLRYRPMFGEKKLLVLKNASLNENFQKKFFKNYKKFSDSEDIILFVEEEISEKNKFFKFLKKSGKSQHFRLLGTEELKNWAKKEFAKKRTKIEPQVLTQLIYHTDSNLWRLSGEIEKLTSYKMKEKIPVINQEDINLLVRPKIEPDIFKTIDALASKNKKQALLLIHQHLEKGNSPLYLFSMINFQFRNLLLIKSKEKPLPEARDINIFSLSKELGMHPYVVKKTINLAKRFSLEQLKKIYQKIFQTDLTIKTGKIDPVTALDILITEV